MSLDIKICGLKTDQAMAAALAGGASHVGFIFFAEKPALCRAGARPAACAKRPRGKAKAVAVTVDASDDFLDEIVAQRCNPTCCSCTAAKPRSAWPR